MKLCCTAFTINPFLLVISVGNVFPLRLTHSVTVSVCSCCARSDALAHELPAWADGWLCGRGEIVLTLMLIMICVQKSCDLLLFFFRDVIVFNYLFLFIWFVNPALIPWHQFLFLFGLVKSNWSCGLHLFLCFTDCSAGGLHRKPRKNWYGICHHNHTLLFSPLTFFLQIVVVVCHVV